LGSYLEKRSNSEHIVAYYNNEAKKYIMDIDEYQKRASATDTTGRGNIALYGLAGEIGTLFTTFKKRFRDRQNAEIFRTSLKEELGDVLWYLSAIATQNDIELGEIAKTNLYKIEQFYGDSHAPFFDDGYPKDEQLPRRFEVHFTVNSKTNRVELLYNGKELGDSLSDNVFEEDNYRFHDAFHIAFIAHLHWSPVIRKLMDKKRRSNQKVDENEDGARAQILEEAVSALIFQNAEDANFYEIPQTIPLSLITMLQRMTSKFEVKECSTASWRNAIYDGCRLFVDLARHSGGVVTVDMEQSKIELQC